MILSVVMPTCNKRELLERSLLALLDQELDREWEIVVVDDGSQDGTDTYLAKLAAQHPDLLRTVSPGVNTGRAAARNLGVRAARGAWILFLDDDIVAPPGLLHAHLEALAGQTDRGTIGLVHTAPELIDGAHFHYLDSRGVAKLTAGKVPARYFVTQNAAVPRQAFLKVGGFDEQFSAYGFEDMELAFRLEDIAGLTFHSVKMPVPVHVHHHTLDQYLDKKRECGRHSLALLARLHPQRITEMRLHWVVDAPKPHRPGLPVRLARALATGVAARGLETLLRHWPTDRHSRPRFSDIYHLGMDAMILAAYRQGLTEHQD
jgi:glycosyltransferase involved in cell wall biosynthesis